MAVSLVATGVTFPDGTTQTTAAVPVAGGFSNMSVYTSSGTFTIPSEITKIKVTVVGGGGSSSSNIESGGGGGGGTAIKIISGLTPGLTLSVTVGGGGSGGGAGGTSQISSGSQSISTVSASGGGGAGRQSLGYGGVGSGGNLNFYGSDGELYDQRVGRVNGGGSFLGGNAKSTGRQYGGGGGAYNTAGAAGVVVIEY